MWDPKFVGHVRPNSLNTPKFDRVSVSVANVCDIRTQR